MAIRLVYFGGVQEALGCTAEDIELPPGVASLRALRDHLGGRGEPWRTLIERRSIRFAVNRSLAGTLDAPVHDGDEVAVFPPVTGG